MNRIAELGDIVHLRRNKSIWADENAYYIITKLDEMMCPIEIQALTKSKTHFVGEIIAQKDLINYISLIKIRASELINMETFLWIKEEQSIIPAIPVHFVGNNRIVEFIIIDGKLVSNMEFDFFLKNKELVKGRIGIQLPTKGKKNLKNKVVSAIKKLADVMGMF